LFYRLKNEENPSRGISFKRKEEINEEIIGKEEHYSGNYK